MPLLYKVHEVGIAGLERARMPNLALPGWPGDRGCLVVLELAEKGSREGLSLQPKVNMGLVKRIGLSQQGINN